MALRIKDNVNLKELEKYGFKVSIHFDYFNIDTEYEYKKPYKCASKYISIILGSDYKVDCSIAISEKNRTIGFGMVNRKYEYELYKKFAENTLYDLIKDGLVEKVEE